MPTFMKPLTVTDSMVFSSTIAEPDVSKGEVVWNSETSYVAGDRCIRVSTHRIYECLIANSNSAPEDNLTGTTPKWMDYAPTNKWSMFDNVVSTPSTATLSLIVVLKPLTGITGLTLLKIVGTSVNVKIEYNGTTIRDETYSLNGTIIGGTYDWFFEPYVQREALIFNDIPPVYDAKITITITGTGAVSCGMCLIGKIKTVGTTEYGTGFGLTDFSGVNTDVYGTTTLIKRGNAKVLKIALGLTTNELEAFDQFVTDITGTPILVQATNEDKFQFLTTYGFCQGHDSTIPTWDRGTSTFEIRGLL